MPLFHRWSERKLLTGTLMQLNGDPAAIFVRSDSSIKTLSDLLDAARATPGKLRMSGTGAGGVWDLARAGMLMAAGMKPDAIMWVPSQGSAPSIVELLGGHIDAVCCSLPEALSQLEAGQLRAGAQHGARPGPDHQRHERQPPDPDDGGDHMQPVGKHKDPGGNGRHR